MGLLGIRAAPAVVGCCHQQRWWRECLNRNWGGLLELGRSLPSVYKTDGAGLIQMFGTALGFFGNSPFCEGNFYATAECCW